MCEKGRTHHRTRQCALGGKSLFIHRRSCIAKGNASRDTEDLFRGNEALARWLRHYNLKNKASARKAHKIIIIIDFEVELKTIKLIYSNIIYN